jgi:CRISPR/Cas system CMR subunit Cmr4 (Cas7 group RAMP superfamily)
MDALYSHLSLTLSRAHALGSAAPQDCSPQSASSTTTLGLSQVSPLCIRTPVRMLAGPWLWITAPSALKVVDTDTKGVTELACTNAVYVRPHHHLRLSPEISGLAKEIFYCHNTFRIRRDPVSRPSDRPLFPIASELIR